MYPSTPRRLWTIAGTGALTLVLTAGLSTWPWNKDDVPVAEAQEETTATDGVAYSEAEALAEAAASGEGVEALNLRSETRDVVANPDGTFTATEYVLPVRTMIDGEWADIDPTLEVDENGTIAPKAATVQLAFSSGGDEPMVTLVKNDHTMTLDWDGDLPEPTIEGDTATYAEVLTDVDLRVTALEDGFTHTLVVKTAEAAENPELAAIEWPVTLDGAVVETNAHGGLAITDETTDDLWLEADTPSMWDSSGVAEAFASDPALAAADPDDADLAAEVAEQVGAQADVEATADVDSVDLVPDEALLTGADTVYPVYIDPVYRSASRTAWAMVASAYSSTEYWKWSGDQGVGNCSAFSAPGALCEKKRIFFRVPTSAYSRKVIVEATFAATLRHNYYGENKAHYADLYLTGGISSSTNWNNQPSGSMVDSANTPAPSGGDCDYSADHATEWDVKTEVANAASKGTSSLTFGVRNDNESDSTHWMRFCNNGHLRVTYNTPPNQPAMDDLRSSAGTCQWTIDATSYTPTLPIVYAALTDADKDQLRGEFWFTDKNNNVLFKAPLTSAKASGLEAQINLETLSGFPAIASGTEVRWEVRAYDGTSYSSWSSSGNPTRCRFIYDTSKPSPPTVSSTDLPAGDTPSPMVGEIGSLTVDSAAADVVAYTVDFDQDDTGPQTITLAAMSDPATVTYMPMAPGRHTANITAVDAAGWTAGTSYSFLVSETGAVGAWSLGDAAGSTEAANSTGANTGTPGLGVTFAADGPGAAPAASFDGSADAYITTPAYGIASTGEGVAIAAWAQVDDLASDGVVASIDGGLGEAGMTLGYRSISSTSGTWVLSMPDMAMGAFSAWEVTGGQVTVTNRTEWVHLVGVWNDFTDQMTLYINGVATDSSARQSAWWGDGTVQIGRANAGGAWADHFDGAIADVRVFDRVVSPDEALELGYQAALRSGYWQFNGVGDDGVSSPDFDDGLPAVLGNGASIYSPTDPDLDLPALNGTGHLVLDGADDYASVSTPNVDTARSFSLAARVRLDTAVPTQSMTLLSIPGTRNSAIEVGYDADSGLWELRMTGADERDAAVQSVTSSVQPTAESQGQAIVVVFDGITGEARLYVNGVPSDPLTGLATTAWTATGSLQIGRGFGEVATDASGYLDYFAGAVDEVRTYSGVLHPVVAAQLTFPFDEHSEI
ncbi:LamG domain-containing protein [Glycomyces sp. A-F 0318]|uniref:LamG domain-containing protein n=1 Tax=Glycomyces amatae TaxID=2881355 RepID=UPI001E4DBD65|nr:LamG domain-containing protein [Glycomyces amatae]MCD0443412.1 LamG domain-containing protein [Glycomyces amatae]